MDFILLDPDGTLDPVEPAFDEDCDTSDNACIDVALDLPAAP